MAKHKNSYDVLAKKADDRLRAVRERDQQLQLLPDEAGVAVEDAAKGKIGRPKGAANKGSSEMRRWLAAQGYAMPEEQLAKIAGLDSRDPLITQAMERTEHVLAWAYQDAVIATGKRKGEPVTPSPQQKVTLMMQFLAIMERAAAAILPYGTPKATPDVNVNQQTTVIVPAGPSQPVDPAAKARDVTPAHGARMVPADVAAEMQRKQSLSEAEIDNSDAQIRTDEAST